MGEFKVYLAGPITGMDYEGCTDWRDRAKKMLADLSLGRIVGYSPMRSKHYLKSEGVILDTYEQTILSSSRGIITRDRYDTHSCDLLFANFLGAKKVSIGTVGECFWADAWRKPIVMAIDDPIPASGGVPEFRCCHDHAMLREITGFRTADFEQAIQTIVKVLLP